MTRADDLEAEIARVRARAASLPTAEELARLISEVARHGSDDVTLDEIRALGATAIRRARQMSYYLGVLAGLTGDGDDPVA